MRYLAVSFDPWTSRPDGGIAHLGAVLYEASFAEAVAKWSTYVSPPDSVSDEDRLQAAPRLNIRPGADYLSEIQGWPSYQKVMDNMETWLSHYGGIGEDLVLAFADKNDPCFLCGPELKVYCDHGIWQRPALSVESAMLGYNLIHEAIGQSTRYETDLRGACKTFLKDRTTDKMWMDPVVRSSAIGSIFRAVISQQRKLYDHAKAQGKFLKRTNKGS